MMNKLRSLSEMLTTLSTMINVLPYYSHPDCCHILMMEFSSKTRTFWKQNLWKWSRVFSKHKEIYGLESLKDLEKTQKICPELFLKYRYRITPHYNEVRSLTRALTLSLPIEITKIYISRTPFPEEPFDDSDDELDSMGVFLQYHLHEFIDCVIQLCEEVNRHRLKLGLERIQVEQKLLKGKDKCTIYKLPCIFVLSRDKYRSDEVVVCDRNVNMKVDEADERMSVQEIVKDSNKELNLFSESCLDEALGKPLNRRSVFFRCKKFIDIHCWEQKEILKLLKTDKIGRLITECKNLKKIKLCICDKKIIHQSAYPIKKLMKEFSKLAMQFRYIDLQEKTDLIISAKKGTLNSTEESEEVIFQLGNLEIEAQIIKCVNLNYYIQISEFEDISGKIVEINEGKKDNEPDEEDTASEKPDCMKDRKPDGFLAKIRIEDIRCLKVYSDSIEFPEKYKNFKVSLVSNEEICKKPFELSLFESKRGWFTKKVCLRIRMI